MIFASSSRPHTSAPPAPTAWLGYLGPAGNEAALRHPLFSGPATQTHVGDGFGLALRPGTDAPATFTVLDGGGASVTLGDPDEAGCAATVTPTEANVKVTLRCDPFGLRGVFTARGTIDNTLWFASDPRLLANAAPSVKNCLDPAALHGYLCFSYVPVPHTLFAGVRALPAGETHILHGADYQIARRAPAPDWRETPPAAPFREEDAARELDARLRASVARRLEGVGGEGGVFLSGGLDSSLVAALLVRAAGVRPRLFTLDFGPPWDIELPFARAVAAHLGLPLHVVSARPRDVRRALVPTAAALQQPFGDPVTVPLYLLGEAAAREGVSVVFNGEGGDQLFGGWANKPMVAATLYAPLAGPLTPNNGGTGGEGDGGGSAGGEIAAYLGTFHRFLGLTDRLYTPSARAATNSIDVRRWVCPALGDPETGSLLHRLRAANLRLKGAQNIAPRAVQLAAAHGLRVEMPFFDRALADWTFGLPPEAFLAGACEKRLLKRVAEAYLPPDIVWRDKRGMGVPATEWCVASLLKRDVARYLSNRRLQADGWFDPAFVAALRRNGNDDDVLPGEFRRRRVGEKLWTLLLLHVWQTAHLREICPP